MVVGGPLNGSVWWHRSTTRRNYRRTSTTIRALALAAHFVAQRLGQPSAPIFGDLLAKHNLPDDIGRKQQFVERVADKFEKTGDMKDASRSGRPPSIPPSLVKECADILREGYEYNGLQCWYVSVEEAARVSPRMARLIGKAQCSPKDMWKAVQRSTPDLILKKLEVKMPLEPDVKAARQEAAAKGMQLTEEDLMRMVFIDEKTIYARPCTSVKVICPRGTELTIGEDWRLLKGGKRSVVVVKGIFAVNAVIGPVLWRPLSGTDGYDTPYKVRCRAPLLYGSKTHIVMLGHVSLPTTSKMLITLAKL